MDKENTNKIEIQNSLNRFVDTINFHNCKYSNGLESFQVSLRQPFWDLVREYKLSAQEAFFIENNINESILEITKLRQDFRAKVLNKTLKNGKEFKDDFLNQLD